MSKVSDVCPSPNPLALSSPPPPRSHCVLVGWDYLTPVLLNVSAVSLWGGGVINKSPPEVLVRLSGMHGSLPSQVITLDTDVTTIVYV